MKQDSDDKKLQKEVAKNMAEFENIVKMNEQYERDKKWLLEEADRLGVDLKREIPWDDLSKEQKKELERIKFESEQELKDMVQANKKPVRPKRWRGEMI